MSDLGLAGGDLDVQAGDLVLIEGPGECRQRLCFALEPQRGEWFLDADLGLRWLDGELPPRPDAILVKDPNIPVIAADVRARIVAEDCVEELLAFDVLFLPVTRELRIEFTVSTREGEEVTATLAVDPEGGVGGILLPMIAGGVC